MIPEIANLLNSIGIILATIVGGAMGVVASTFKDSMARPKLTLRHDRNNGDDWRYFYHEKSGVEELWVRARVSSIGHGEKAKNVQFKLVSISRNDGLVDNRSHWWFKVSSICKVATDIYQDLEQPFDLIYLRQKGTTTEAFMPVLRPELSTWQKEQQLLEKDKRNRGLALGVDYTIRGVLVSDNAVTCRININFSVSSVHRPASLSSNDALGLEPLKDAIHIRAWPSVRHGA